jgi:hypothetical protein
VKKKHKLVPDKVKGTGFYVPMDIAPGEYGSTVDYKRLKEVILYAMEQDWGPRCKTKDYDDFPELDPLFAIGDPEAGRCPVCLVYEKFDAFWEKLDFEHR